MNLKNRKDLICISNSAKYPVKYKGYEISKIMHGYRVTKVNDSSDKHTHLNSLRMCYFVIDSVSDKKLQYKSSKWIINSLMRLSDDKSCIGKLEEVLEVREQKYN